MKLYCNLTNYDNKLLEILKRNPHTAQFFCSFENSKIVNSNKNKKLKGVIKPLDYERKKFNKNREDPHKKYHTIDNYIADLKKYSRTIVPSMPRIPYSQSDGKLHTLIHWGQLKLLFSEIEFLTLHSKDDSFVIYAGSAPGTHILVLADMFKKLEFVLVDPRKFNPGLSKLKNVKLINDYLNKDSAKEIKKLHKDRDILLISDIRTGLDIGSTDFPSDKEVYDDMKLQQSFYKLLEPKWSMFKFRLPWNAKTMSYLEGKIYLQIYAGPQSSETRLIVGKNSKKKTYDAVKYDEQLYYFNTITRCQFHDHNYTVEGMDHCYDCYTAFRLLDEYYKKFGNKSFRAVRILKVNKINNKTDNKTNNKANIKELIEETMKYIIEVLSEDGKNRFCLDYEVVV